MNTCSLSVTLLHVYNHSDEASDLNMSKENILFKHQHSRVSIIQGDSKVLDTFVLPIYSMSSGAQKKYYCQIKAEILKFM
jgi:hypothetical protein